MQGLIFYGILIYIINVEESAWFVFSLIHQDVHFIPCSDKEPVYYESFILTINEGLRLSCEVCEFCENENITECKEPDFEVDPVEVQPVTLSDKYKKQKQTLILYYKVL